MALADGGKNYMPPALIKRMVDELAILPMWYAAQGDFVLAASAYNLSFLKEMKSLLGMEVDLMTYPELEEEPHVAIHPWGWDESLCATLRRWRVDAKWLPGPAHIVALRELSHRKQAVVMLPQLRMNEHYCGESHCFSSMEACADFVSGCRKCVLKAPLSGSGKGLNWCKGKFTPLIANWCNRTLGKQGCVVGEPVYDKVLDFAMEFHVDDDEKVEFIGYSAFSTSASGAYESNLLMSDEQIEELLTKYIDVNEIKRLREVLLIEIKARFADSYCGCLGVDMMICKFEQSPNYRIHPCVEINVRMNMGILTHTFYQRFVQVGAKGCFKVEYYPHEGEVLRLHQQMRLDNPLVLSQQRILSGYLSLIPVSARSHYHVFVSIG